MSYFKYFPEKLRKANFSEPYSVVATNILRRVAIKNKVSDEKVLFYKHLIADDDTPETIAFRLYGRADYHWIIWLVNQIIDPYTGWPMAYDKLHSFIESKYPGYTLRLSPNTSIITFSEDLANGFFAQGSFTGTAGESGTVLRFDYVNTSCSYLFVNNLSGNVSAASSELVQGSNSSSSISNVTFQGGFTSNNSIYQASTGARGRIVWYDATNQQLVVEPTNNLRFEAPNNILEYDLLVEVETGKQGILQHSLGSYSPVVESPDAIHHFVDSDGNVVHRDTDLTTSNTSEQVEPSGQGPVTNRDWEYEINESKAAIYLLKESFVKDFVDEFEATLIKR